MLPKQEACVPPLVGEPRFHMPLAQTKNFFKNLKNKFSLWHVPLTLVLRYKNSVSYTITFLVSIFLCASKYVARREVGVKKRNILSSLQAPFQSWF